MRIGELANRAGVNIQTIRFYERQRLLRKPARTPSGYRIYEEADLEIVQFVKECQRLGFTLNEVRELRRLHVSISSPPAGGRGREKEVRSILRLTQEKLESVRRKIDSLRAIERQLASSFEKPGKRRAPACPAKLP